MKDHTRRRQAGERSKAIEAVGGSSQSVSQSEVVGQVVSGSQIWLRVIQACGVVW